MLDHGGREVFAVLLHEAAHGLAETRGIRDTSRQGRYHNAHYRALATELGLGVRQDTSAGWSDTSIPDTTAEAYRGEIGRLDEALTAYRLPEEQNQKAASSSVAACCDCGRRIRVRASVLAAGPIVCGVCGSEFEAQW